MVYVQHWGAYASGVKAMQNENASQLRFCSRWRHSEGVLTLKATNDRQCLQFRTRSALYLNRFQALIHESMAGMQSKRQTASNAPEHPDKLAQGGQAAIPPSQGLGSAVPIAESTGSLQSGVAKKKKSKKSKK